MRSSRLVITGKTYLTANTRFMCTIVGIKLWFGVCACVGEDLHAPPLGSTKPGLCLTLFMHVCELMCVLMFVFSWPQIGACVCERESMCMRVRIREVAACVCITVIDFTLRSMVLQLQEGKKDTDLPWLASHLFSSSEFCNY